MFFWYSYQATFALITTIICSWLKVRGKKLLSNAEQPYLSFIYFNDCLNLGLPKDLASSEVGLSGIGYWLQDASLAKHEIIFLTLQVRSRILTFPPLPPPPLFFLNKFLYFGVWQWRATPVCCVAALVHLSLVFVWAGIATSHYLLCSLGCFTLLLVIPVQLCGAWKHYFLKLTAQNK